MSHDMSIIDKMLGIDGEIFKLIYTTFAGISLILFTVTGIWLRYRSKRAKRSE